MEVGLRRTFHGGLGLIQRLPVRPPGDAFELPSTMTATKQLAASEGGGCRIGHQAVGLEGEVGRRKRG